MNHYELIRLRGDEDWAAWGDGWWDHVERLGEVSFVDDRRTWPDAVRERKGTQLDWGAWLTELSLDELRQMLSRDLQIEHVQKTIREQDDRFAALPPTGRYGLVFVEDY